MKYLFDRSLYSKTIFPETLFVHKESNKVTITFNIVDSITKQNVSIDSVKINNKSCKFTQTGKTITLDVPKKGTFNIRVDANDYNAWALPNTDAVSLNLFNAEIMPLHTTVTFNLADSISGKAVTPTSLKLNDLDQPYTQSGKVITTTVPTSNSFTLKITANKYNDYSSTYNYNTLNGASINMVAKQETGNMQVSVTWNHSATETQRDLDSFLYIYTNSSMTTEALDHVYHGHKDSSDSHTHIQLVKDDTGGTSDTGETVNFIPFYKDYTYRFYIKDYTHRSQTGPSGFADWHAKVTVTYNNEVVFTAEAPETARGVFWNVFKLIDGNFTKVDKFQDNEPTN